MAPIQGLAIEIYRHNILLQNTVGPDGLDNHVFEIVSILFYFILSHNLGRSSGHRK